MLGHKQHLPPVLPCNLTIGVAAFHQRLLLIQQFQLLTQARTGPITRSRGRNQIVLKIPLADPTTLLHTSLISSEPS